MTQEKLTKLEQNREWELPLTMVIVLIVLFFIVAGTHLLSDQTHESKIIPPVSQTETLESAESN